VKLMATDGKVMYNCKMLFGSFYSFCFALIRIVFLLLLLLFYSRAGDL
jgi:hypothetical protein